MNKNKVAKCKGCKRTISAILSPYEAFKKQIKRMVAGFCSTYCEGK